MITDEITMPASVRTPVAARVQRTFTADTGRWATHYAMVLIFFWFGALKVTDFEASGIAPLVINSPALMWMNGVFGIAGTAYVLGTFEILTGVFLALRPVKPRLGVLGGFMAIVTFVITISFMFTTPGVVQPGFDSPLALSVMPGQFLLKDVVMLCVSVWILGASLDETDR